MYRYVLSSFIAFVLFSMGLIAGILGTVNYFENRKSRSGRQMFYVCWSVFFWNFGYAWMSMSYGDDFAYMARALALLAVTAYTFFVIRYIATVTKYPLKKYFWILAGIVAMSLISWTQIVQKDAVDFTVTPWGYWYISKMSWARIVQFIGILGTIILYNVIIHYGKKNAKATRDLYVLKLFSLFSPILLTACLMDTFIPTVFHTAAVPGSCIGAFISSMLLFKVSRQNKTFGLSAANVSEYVFHDIATPVIITDKDGEIVLYNDMTLSYLLCGENELKNKKIESIFEVIEEGVYKVADVDYICKLDKTDVYDRFDEINYSIYFVQDITKERENLRMIEESREVAEKASQAKSEFLANMSHEIRTPLNAVLGIDEMIIRESTEDPIVEYAENIKQAGTMLLSLINDILDFSKIESGKMELQYEEFETASVVKDLILIVEKRAQSKNLKINVDIDSNIPSKIYGDSFRIRQILINILTNSIKYTQEGEITVSTRLVSKTDTEAKIRVSIKDTGIGIKKEDLKNLFNAFQRVDLTKNRNIEGTGLGLSITNNLLKLMGSELQVKSEYGKGSEFYYEITHKIVDATPIGEDDTNLAKTEKRQKQKTSLFTAPTASILIVDDNKINLKVASGLLKRSEAQVTTAMSGPESIELVKKNKFDVILMDHMMPEMDGVEAVTIMKSLDENMSKDAAVIALTANAVAGAKEMFLANGFDDFISKPIKVEDLENALLKYLPEEKVVKE